MRRTLGALALIAIVGCAGTERELDVRPLVDAKWLSEHLDEVVVLDIRAGGAGGAAGAAYEVGHVPGAVHSPYGRDPWRVTRDGVPGMLPPVEDLERLIGGLGISNHDYVVIVPAGANAAEFGTATRIYWEFKVLGHDRVSILNGGYAAWEAAGYPVETERSVREPATFEARFRPELVADKEDVLAAIEKGIPLIDARSVDYYRGVKKSRVAARYGTIAGAKNVPQDRLTVENGGTFVDAAAVAQLWQEAGLPTEGEQIVFCNTGHLASLGWFAGYELLGNKEVKLYDGSLAEWSVDPELPMDNTGNSGSGTTEQ
jgi:thiosulfate/3-mercaptopyruvate sulfurtransferase